MNLVLETASSKAAFEEKRDWVRLGHLVRITEVKKVFRGAFQTVYRVWAGKRVRRQS